MKTAVEWPSCLGNKVLSLKLVNIDIDDDTRGSPLNFSLDGYSDSKAFLSDQDETDLEEEIKTSLAGTSGSK